MVLKNLVHQAVHGPPDGRELMEHLGAALFSRESALEPLDLATDAAHTRDEASLPLQGVSHSSL